VLHRTAISSVADSIRGQIDQISYEVRRWSLQSTRHPWLARSPSTRRPSKHKRRREAAPRR
jgi:hypothetical protein